MKGKYSYWVSLLLIGAIFVFACIRYASFEMICSVCAILFWVVQRALFNSLGKEGYEQKKYCRFFGFFLLIPASGIIITGIMLLFWEYRPYSVVHGYYIIGISAILFVCLLLQLIGNWKDKTLSGRFLRHTIIASCATPLSLIVVLLLSLTGADENTTMSLMSMVGFGSVSVLFASNMIMVSAFDYESTRNSIKSIRDLLKRNKLVFTRVSILKDTFLVVGKSIIGIISMSFFMFVNALYSGGMGIARVIALKMHEQERKKQIHSYRCVGIIISISSICYALYSVRLFFGGQTGVFNMNVALSIALYTFVEFGINIREAIRLRKSKVLEAKALRAISFASTLICFVLTQTAIMSFTSTTDNSFVNALSGVIFGVLASLIGLWVVVDSFIHQKVFAIE